jgi:hypothetical protein
MKTKSSLSRYYSIVLSVFSLFISLSHSLMAQTKYTISVPTKHYSTAGGSPTGKASTLVKEIEKYAKVHQLINCTEKINPTLEEKIKSEMKKIKAPTPYTVIIDYNSCEFISIRADKGESQIFSPSWTIYTVTLYPEITYPSDTPKSYLCYEVGIVNEKGGCGDSKLVINREVVVTTDYGTAYSDLKKRLYKEFPVGSAGGNKYTLPSQALVKPGDKIIIYTYNIKRQSCTSTVVNFAKGKSFEEASSIIESRMKASKNSYGYSEIERWPRSL